MEKMEEKAQRFNQALNYAKEHGLIKSQQHLADMMGAGKASVSAAKNGNPEKLTDSFLLRFNSVLGNVFYTPWLISGAGTMLGAGDPPSMKMVIHVNLATSVGGQLHEIATDGITAAQCDTVYSPIDNAEMAIEVYGDSMAPSYPSGSRVFIRKIDMSSFISWGSVFVIDSVNGIYIKEVQRGSDDSRILCVSHNNSGRFPPFEIPLKDIYGMWRVLACITVTQ